MRYRTQSQKRNVRVMGRRHESFSFRFFFKVFPCFTHGDLELFITQLFLPFNLNLARCPPMAPLLCGWYFHEFFLLVRSLFPVIWVYGVHHVANMEENVCFSIQCISVVLFLLLLLIIFQRASSWFICLVHGKISLVCQVSILDFV